MKPTKLPDPLPPPVCDRLTEIHDRLGDAHRSVVEFQAALKADGPPRADDAAALAAADRRFLAIVNAVDEARDLVAGLRRGEC